MGRSQLLEQITHLEPHQFDQVALNVFRYQARHNPIYAEYLDLLRIDPVRVTAATDIPHLPIALFKTHDLKSGSWKEVRTFTSSGTTGSTTSRHPLREEAYYRNHTVTSFERQYGSLQGRAVFALLPSYLERTGSSLVLMAEEFIRRSNHPDSGFFLHDLTGLSEALQRNRDNTDPPLLIGVSFALLDLAEQYPQDLSSTIVMETGGMKGRRRELTRTELHQQLSQAFGVHHIHSEYGMTELLSQAYAPKDGRFHPAATLRASTRQVTDPFSPAGVGRTGVLNLTDLANLDTISFVATDDLGRVYEDGSFEVLGRLDASDVRGCNLLVLE